MRILFKILRSLHDLIMVDLVRPHTFASERVGFISCQVGALHDGGIVIVAQQYHPVEDSDYKDDPTVGAMMGAGAIRRALQIAYNKKVAMFHVHHHDHHGLPKLSRVDQKEAKKFVPDFFNVRPEFPHGVLVFSHDSAMGLYWASPTIRPQAIYDFTFVGAPMSLIRGPYVKF